MPFLTILDGNNSKTGNTNNAIIRTGNKTITSKKFIFKASNKKQLITAGQNKYLILSII